MFLVAAVDLDVLDLADLADGQQLRARLLAGAEQADARRRRAGPCTCVATPLAAPVRTWPR